MVTITLSEKETTLLVEALGFALMKIDDDIDAYEQELQPHECAEVMILDMLRRDINILLHNIKEPQNSAPEPVIKPIETIIEIDPDDLEIL
jgi:hypothetical protein